LFPPVRIEGEIVGGSEPGAQVSDDSAVPVAQGGAPEDGLPWIIGTCLRPGDRLESPDDQPGDDGEAKETAHRGPGKEFRRWLGGRFRSAPDYGMGFRE
jgi:hypothetical protein